VKSRIQWIVCAMLLIGLISHRVHSQSWDNLVQTPPMGWNSWNYFQHNVSEDLIKSIADAMVGSGMKDAGYEYVIIDDHWQVGRDENGNILADPDRFPSGIKGLADYIHSLDLKFGIYSCAGTHTCGGRPGSRGYEYQDALQYAKWGVDYLKYDWCHHGTQSSEASYQIMSDALQSTGRPIVFSICEWGTTKPWLWAKDIGHLWRTTFDIKDCFDCTVDLGGGYYGYGWTHILDKQVGLESFSGPGHWNDPDMLEVGNGGMSFEEYKAHFSLWCMLSAQDPLGKQAEKVRDDGNEEVWVKQLKDGNRAVVLFNRGETRKEIFVNWLELDYPAHLYAQLFDLWQNNDVVIRNQDYSASVPPHGVVMLRVEIQ